VQRAYRARLAAAGKVVRIVDANALPVLGFDPAKDGIFEREMIASLREQLRIALSKMEIREEEVARLRDRTAHLESELKLQERHLTNALKEKVALEQKLAQKPARRR